MAVARLGALRRALPPARRALRVGVLPGGRRERTFTVEQAGTPGPATRSALIPARITHRIVSEADRMAFCYLDPGSVWHHRCHSAMTRGGVIAYDHKQIAALAAAAAVLRRTRDARAWLELACPQEVVTDSPSADPGGRVRSDARIEWTLSSLQAADLHSDLSATALATQAGLSTSRFLHLFRQHTGTSLRRHRSWLRMISAARRVRDGADLTTAAMDAGFASPSHFSRPHADPADSADFAARQFLRRAGYVEDPATGVAAAALAAHIAINRDTPGWHTWRIAQGRAIGRPSLLIAEAQVNRSGGVIATRVGGTAHEQEPDNRRL